MTTIADTEPRTVAANPARKRNTDNHTANRSIRISDDVWARALARAEQEGRVVSTMVRDFVTLYADGGQDPTVELLARDEQLRQARRVAAELAVTLGAAE